MGNVSQGPAQRLLGRTRERLESWAWYRRPRALVQRAGDDEVDVHSAALALQALWSVVPLMLLAGSVIGFVFAGNEALVDEWQRRLTNAVPGLTSILGQNLHALVDARLGAGLLGIVGLAWTGSSLAQSATSALGKIFRTPGTNPLLNRVNALWRLAVVGALLLASLALTTVATSAASGAGLTILGIAAGFVVDVGTALLLYTTLTPAGGPPLSAHVPGAVVFAFGWTIVKVAGSWYVTYVVSRATALYGTIGAVFGLLAVLSITARVFLYGAEITAVRWERRRDGPRTP
jgi:membrane protein